MRYISDDGTIVSSCPACGVEQEDHDGFGVLFCEACGYCECPSGTADSNGLMRCDLCGEAIVTR